MKKFYVLLIVLMPFLIKAQINNFPWHENFANHNSGAGTVVNGWTCNSALSTVYSWRVFNVGTSTSSSTGPASDNSGDHNYIYTEASGYSSGDIAYITSPMFDVTSLNTPELTFYYHMYGYDMGTLEVEVVKGAVITTEFTISGQQHISENAAWTKAIVDLSGYTGNIQIRFKGIRGNGYRSDMSVDDFDLHEKSLCPGTTSESTSDILDVSAKFNWTETGNANSWIIEYGTTGFTQGNGTTVNNIMVEHYSINGLSPSTDYDWYVRSDCGVNGNSVWAGPFSFTTLPAIVSTPWSEDFESMATLGYHYYPTGMDGSGALFSSHSTTSQPATSGNTYMLCLGAGTAYLYTPPIDIVAGNSYDITFNYLIDGAGPNDSWDLKVVKGSSKSGYTMAQVGNALTNQSNANYKQFKATYIAGSSSPMYFGIKLFTSSFTTLYLDDIRIEETPSCPQPAILQSDNISINSADLSWTETGMANNWDVEWKSGSDFNPGIGASTGSVAVNPNATYHLSNLTPQSTYYYYVRANCGAGNFSNWTGYQSFTTIEGKATNPNPADSAVPIAINATLLDWDDVPGADSYTINIGTSPGGTDIANAVACANSSYIKPANWNYGTRYYWTVNTIYNGGSSISGEEWNFFTECDIENNFPYTDSFENGVPSDCWFENDVNGTTGEWASTNSSPNLSGSNQVLPHNGNSMAYFNSLFSANTHSTRLETPSFDFTGITSPEMTFWMFHDNTYSNGIDRIQIQVYTGAAWVNIGNPIYRYAAYGSSYYKSWGLHTIDLSAYSGSIVKIGFLAINGDGMDMFIDEVTVQDAPNCTPPQTQHVSNITLTTADLSWLASLGTNQWDIEYGVHGFVKGTGTIVSATQSNPQQIIGLSGATSYDWYVRTDCGSGSYSSWIGPHTFTTRLFDSQTVNGTTTKCSPTYNRLNEDGSQAPAGEYFYDQFSFTVPTTGLYNISALWNGFTGYLHLYSTAFDSENPAVNWMDGKEEGLNHNSKIENATLASGTTYIIVGTAEYPNTADNFGGGQYHISGVGIANVQATTDINGAAIGVSANVAATDGSVRSANYQCEDNSSWTHYYDDNGTASNYSDDNIILSVKKNANNIGSIGDAGFSVTVAGAAGVSHIQNAQAPYVQDAGGWYVYNRFWNLTPTSQPNSAVNVRYYYTTADFTALQTAINNVGGSVPQSHQGTAYFKINSISGNYDPNPSNGHVGVPLANAYNADGCWIYENGNVSSTSNWKYGTYKGAHFSEIQIGHFSGGGGGASPIDDDSGSPLPIMLSSFEAYENNEMNTIIWTTLSEENTKEFIIEKATETDFQFEYMTSVSAANNSNMPLNYSVDDLAPNVVTYYRLRTIDFNGEESVSKTIIVKRKNLINSTSIISLYPNPTTGISTLVFNSPVSIKTKIQVTNVLGDIVLDKSITTLEGMNKYNLNLGRLQNGVYFVTIRNDYSTITSRIVKQ